jgi:hypothetical protein
MRIRTGAGIGNHLMIIITMTFNQIMIIIGMIGKVIIGVMMILMDGGVNGKINKKIMMEILIGGMMMDGEMTNKKKIKNQRRLQLRPQSQIQLLLQIHEQSLLTLTQLFK